MRRALILILCCCALAACGSGGVGGSAVLPQPGGGGFAPPPVSPTPSATPSPSPTFDSSSVHIAQYTAPTTPQYVAAAPDGAVYLGNGANGSGSNLYRYDNGAFTQTPPAAPPSGYGPGGGVYGITAAGAQVYWLSAYSGSGFAPYVDVECGGNGSASLCEPTVDQPATMTVDANGTFWIGGSTFDGAGTIATSSGQNGTLSGAVVQLIRGPSNAIWGALDEYPNYAIAQFALSSGGVAIAQQFMLPSGDAIGSIAYGSDGALWFTDQQNNAIGRMDAHGNVTEFPIPTAGALGNPWYGVWQIASACDGSLWFTEPGAGKIARIDVHGTISEFPLSNPKAYPASIAASQLPGCTGPQMWVGEQQSGQIAAVSF